MRTGSVHDIYLLLQLLGFCILALLPVALGVKFNAHPLIYGASLFLAKILMENSTFYQMAWSYALIGSLRWITSSYREYQELSLGGPEPSFKDWCAVVALNIFAWVDATKPPRARRDEVPYRGRIFRLPHRRGRRPTVKSVAPNRQLDQKGSPAIFYTVGNMLQSYQLLHPEHLQIKQSALEHDVSALFVGAGSLGHQQEEGKRGWEGEIAHVHVADGSVHVVLHPEDVKTVIEAGWGQRHPLCANNKRWFRFYFDVIGEGRLPVPEGLVLVYAPRSQREIEVLDAIIQSAIWYATKGGLYPVTAGTVYPLVEIPTATRKQKERVFRLQSRRSQAEGEATARQTDIQVHQSPAHTEELGDALCSNPWCSNSESASSSLGSATLNDAAETAGGNIANMTIPVFPDEESFSSFSSSSQWCVLSKSPQSDADATIGAAWMVPEGRGGLHAHAREALAGQQRPWNLEMSLGRGGTAEKLGDSASMERDISDAGETSFGEDDFF